MPGEKESVLEFYRRGGAPRQNNIMTRRDPSHGPLVDWLVDWLGGWWVPR